jgi:hypothetical protein
MLPRLRFLAATFAVTLLVAAAGLNFVGNSPTGAGLSVGMRSARGAPLSLAAPENSVFREQAAALASLRRSVELASLRELPAPRMGRDEPHKGSEPAALRARAATKADPGAPPVVANGEAAKPPASLGAAQASTPSLEKPAARREPETATAEIAAPDPSTPASSAAIGAASPATDAALEIKGFAETEFGRSADATDLLAADDAATSSASAEIPSHVEPQPPARSAEPPQHQATDNALPSIMEETDATPGAISAPGTAAPPDTATVAEPPLPKIIAEDAQVVLRPRPVATKAAPRKRARSTRVRRPGQGVRVQSNAASQGAWPFKLPNFALGWTNPAAKSRTRSAKTPEPAPFLQGPGAMPLSR